MQVFPTRPNLNTSVLKWKRVSGISAGHPMVVSRARLERKIENRAGIACWMLIDLMLELVAIDRARRQYCADISWGGPNGNGRDPSEDYYANLACQL